jgi:hypothetical protein
MMVMDVQLEIHGAKIGENCFQQNYSLKIVGNVVKNRKSRSSGTS